MADIYAPFMEQILDVAQLKWKPNIYHYGKADDLGGSFEIAEWILIFHYKTL